MLIEDCYFGTGHGASIGSITDGNVKNITFRNIVMAGTDNGCRIKTKAGYSSGSVTDIVFANFTMTGVKNPLVLDGLYTASVNSSTRTDSAKIDNVTFINILSQDSEKASQLECNIDNPCMSRRAVLLILSSSTVTFGIKCLSICFFPLAMCVLYVLL